MTRAPQGGAGPRVVSLAEIADVAARIMQVCLPAWTLVALRIRPRCCFHAAPHPAHYHEQEPGLLVENQREAFIMLSRGDVCLCPIQTLGQKPLQPLLSGPDAQVCVKTGYCKGDDVFCLKVAGGGGQSSNTGMVQVFCQKTLRLQCLLQDEGILTEMRTAAASCLASSLLMPRDIAAVGLCGGSVQAIWHLRFLRGILPPQVRKVIVKTRTQKSAERLRDTMLASAWPADREWDIVTFEEERARGIQAPFVQCALIHTVTCARSPVLTAADVFGDMLVPCLLPLCRFRGAREARLTRAARYQGSRAPTGRCTLQLRAPTLWGSRSWASTWWGAPLSSSATSPPRAKSAANSSISWPMVSVLLCFCACPFAMKERARGPMQTWLRMVGCRWRLGKPTCRVGPAAPCPRPAAPLPGRRQRAYYL